MTQCTWIHTLTKVKCKNTSLFVNIITVCSIFILMLLHVKYTNGSWPHKGFELHFNSVNANTSVLQVIMQSWATGNNSWKSFGRALCNSHISAGWCSCGWCRCFYFKKKLRLQEKKINHQPWIGCNSCWCLFSSNFLDDLQTTGRQHLSDRTANTISGKPRVHSVQHKHHPEIYIWITWLRSHTISWNCGRTWADAATQHWTFPS